MQGTADGNFVFAVGRVFIKITGLSAAMGKCRQKDPQITANRHFFGYIRPNGVKKINKAQQKSVECKKKQRTQKSPKKINSFA